MNLRRPSLAVVCLLAVFTLCLVAASAPATDTYVYGADEYVTISEGISPDGRLLIAAHQNEGQDDFRLYLFDAVRGKKIGPLDEITEVLDTGAGSFGARWKPDSAEATIVYRVDRHAPLKAMTYRFAKGRAIPATRRPVDVHDEGLVQFWNQHCSNPRPPERTFGTPRAQQ